ncbi:MAG: hypothetical protein FK734_00615 [Asgard group archaeon]|nr:hypothetical protein [Asgard group archaeon]
MKKSLISYFLLFNLLISILPINASSIGNYTNELDINISGNIFSDFSDFTQTANSSEISSINNNQSIDMAIQYNITETTVWESYDYIFGLNEGLFKFDLQVDCNYFYNGSMLNTICLILGSYHNESGNIVEANSICWCTIDDSWESNTGNYTIVGFPNQIEDRRTVGIIANEANISFHVTRTNSSLTCSIKKSGDVIQSAMWLVSNGFTRNLDFIRLLLYATPNYINYTEVQFTAISLNYVSTPTNTISLILGPAIVDLMIGSIIIMLTLHGLSFISKYKKR